MSGKSRAAIAARERARAVRARAAVVEVKPKTKAELTDELTAAGVEVPKKATKAELEALAAEQPSGLGTVTTADLP